MGRVGIEGVLNLKRVHLEHLVAFLNRLDTVFAGSPALKVVLMRGIHAMCLIQAEGG